MASHYSFPWRLFQFAAKRFARFKLSGANANSSLSLIVTFSALMIFSLDSSARLSAISDSLSVVSHFLSARA
ncbi:hypothetical protein CXF72_11155 [Psychromonas sp. MB-3u-54]|nr:hypothetical protein CXF72_11155 [Psychromonas sp. MB-3u-54]